jgi:hypothetical protein
VGHPAELVLRAELARAAPERLEPLVHLERQDERAASALALRRIRVCRAPAFVLARPVPERLEMSVHRIAPD